MLARDTSKTIIQMLSVLALVGLTACGTIDPEDGYDGQAKSGLTTQSFELKLPEICEERCTLQVSTTLNLFKVVYEADGWLLGESTDADAQFSISYEFNQAGARQIKATGYFDELTDTVETQMSLNVELQYNVTDVPYFYQYANQLSPSASCQNTSIAMVLGAYGASVTPDNITSRWGKNYAQSPEGVAAVFNAYSNELGLGVRATSTRAGSLSGLRASLDQGKPVIIHGFFTSSGHVLVVLGYDANGYYVNDPAGTWSKGFMSGYPYGWEPTAGKGIYYPKNAFETAVSTLNGTTYEPLWYSTVN